jgi:ankyrin repeat protein
VNAQNKQGQTALMKAAQQGNKQMVRLLIDEGADVNEADYTGRTALDWAKSSRKQSVVDVLVQAGAH